jgi:osmotically-inducible protein OsmY
MTTVQFGLLLAIIVCFLTGCTAGLVMLADDKRSLGELTDDTAITSSINIKYATDELVSPLDVDVDTFRGVVTLNGLVANQETATRAIDLALATKNVTKVISNLTLRNQALSQRGLVYQ